VRESADENDRRVERGAAEEFLAVGDGGDHTYTGEGGEGELLPSETADALGAEEQRVVGPAVLVAAAGDGPRGGVSVGRDGVAQAGEVSAERRIKKGGDEERGEESEDDVAARATGRGAGARDEQKRDESGGEEERGAGLGGLHEANAGAGGDGPTRATGVPPANCAEEGGEGEGDEERFLDEVAAVVDGGGRDGHERGGGEARASGRAGGRERRAAIRRRCRRGRGRGGRWFR